MAAEHLTAEQFEQAVGIERGASNDPRCREVSAPDASQELLVDPLDGVGQR